MEGADWEEPVTTRRNKFSGPRVFRTSIRGQPHLFVDEWMELVKEKCGPTPGEVWTVQQYTHKLRSSFGGQTSLFKIHFYLGAILQTMVRMQEPMLGLARLVQLHKAVHQCGIDGGRWVLAGDLLDIDDPLKVETFAGVLRELERIATHHKNMNDLKASMQKTLQTEQDRLNRFKNWKWQQQQQWD